MPMKPTFLLRIMVLLLLTASCTEQSNPRRTTTLESREVIDLLKVSDQFNALTKQKITLSLIKTSLEDGVKKESLTNYFNSIFQGASLDLATEILRNFPPSTPQNFRTTSSDQSFNTLSSPVTQLTDQLNTDILNTLGSQESDQSELGITTSLKRVITNFRQSVLENSALSFDETRSLLAVADFQSNSASSIVAMCAEAETQSNARTNGWFRRLVSVVVAVVVATVTVVAIAATGGALAVVAGAVISTAGWGTLIGVAAVVGAVIGTATGIDLAFNKDSYITGYNPGNIGGGFLDWEPCYQNPGACPY